jgi:hypothetical protein
VPKQQQVNHKALREQAERQVERAVLEGAAIGQLLAHLDNSTRVLVQSLVVLGSTGNTLALSIVGRLVDLNQFDPDDMTTTVNARVAHEVGELRHQLVQLGRVLIAGDAAEDMDTGELARLDPGAAAIRDHARNGDDSTLVLGNRGVDGGGRIAAQVGDGTGDGGEASASGAPLSPPDSGAQT